MAEHLRRRRVDEHYPDYQAKQMTGSGITAQYTAVSQIREGVRTREMQIADKAVKALKCSDGEGSCSAADSAADKATLRSAYSQIIADYDKALVAIGQQVEAARKARAADIASAQRDLGPAQYGSAAKSSVNRQRLAAYHNAVLIEVEQLLALSEDSAKWAATRYKDRTINFNKID
jgi:serine/threonine protein kinase HipA of HipAB toxin-antitoxin module